MIADEELLFNSEDVCILLYTLQEITTRTSHGAGSDYLSILARSTKTKDEKGALQRLQIVRLALAKYFARWGAVSAGGRPDAVLGFSNNAL